MIETEMQTNRVSLGVCERERERARLGYRKTWESLWLGLAALTSSNISDFCCVSAHVTSHHRDGSNYAQVSDLLWTPTSYALLSYWLGILTTVWICLARCLRSLTLFFQRSLRSGTVRGLAQKKNLLLASFSVSTSFVCLNLGLYHRHDASKAVILSNRTEIAFQSGNVPETITSIPLNLPAIPRRPITKETRQDTHQAYELSVTHASFTSSQKCLQSVYKESPLNF